MSKANRQLIARAALLLIPVFFLWQFAVGTVMVPAMVGSTNLWLNTAYSNLQPELTYKESTHEWIITTRMFVPPRPWPNNTYKPNFKLNELSHVPMVSREGLTLGLALFWLLVLISSSTGKTKRLLIGSVTILSVTCVLSMLGASYKIIQALDTDHILRILTPDGYIKLPPEHPQWLPLLLKPLIDVITLCAIFIMPMLLAYPLFSQNVSNQENSDTIKNI